MKKNKEPYFGSDKVKHAEAEIARTGKPIFKSHIVGKEG